jgi:hypothetical protein
MIKLYFRPSYSEQYTYYGMLRRKEMIDQISQLMADVIGTAYVTCEADKIFIDIYEL